MKKKAIIIGSAMLLALSCVGGSDVFGALVQVPLEQFGTGGYYTTYESFENVVWENAETNANGGVVPGSSTNYIFSTSEVQLTSPIPNSADGYNPRITVYNWIDDFVLGSTYGRINSTDKIPNGNNYLIHAGGLDEPFELTFPQNTVKRVGGYWIVAGDSLSNDRIKVEAFGLDGGSLGTVFIPACYVQDWKNNFYGFESEGGEVIKKITIDKYSLVGSRITCHPGVDYLMFDHMPEPATLTMLAIGGLFVFRRRK